MPEKLDAEIRKMIGEAEAEDFAELEATLQKLARRAFARALEGERLEKRDPGRRLDAQAVEAKNRDYSTGRALTKAARMAKDEGRLKNAKEFKRRVDDAVMKKHGAARVETIAKISREDPNGYSDHSWAVAEGLL